jgi:hypothetical protein
MCGHGMKAAGRLDVGRADGFVVRTEIDGLIADPTWQADRVQTLATEPASDSFMTAWLVDAVAVGWSFAACALAYRFSA